jgi:hypothetical protein
MARRLGNLHLFFKRWQICKNLGFSPCQLDRHGHSHLKVCAKTVRAHRQVFRMLDIAGTPHYTTADSLWRI